MCYYLSPVLTPVDCFSIFKSFFFSPHRTSQHQKWRSKRPSTSRWIHTISLLIHLWFKSSLLSTETACMSLRGPARNFKKIRKMHAAPQNIFHSHSLMYTHTHTHTHSLTRKSSDHAAAACCVELTDYSWKSFLNPFEILFVDTTVPLTFCTIYSSLYGPDNLLK